MFILKQGIRRENADLLTICGEIGWAKDEKLWGWGIC